MNVDWSTLVQTFVGAGVGTAVVTGLISIYRDHRHKKSQAAYMAMRLAVVLEAVAADCSDLIADNATARQSADEQFPDWKTKLPELPPYPDDAEGWRAIDRKLAGRCLNSCRLNYLFWLLDCRPPKRLPAELCRRALHSCNWHTADRPLL
jgi:hypothetical protein